MEEVGGDRQNGQNQPFSKENDHHHSVKAKVTSAYDKIEILFLYWHSFHQMNAL